MGAGIAQVCIEAGVPVVGREVIRGARRARRAASPLASRAPSRRGSPRSGAGRRRSRASPDDGARGARGLRARDRGGVEDIRPSRGLPRARRDRARESALIATNTSALSVTRWPPRAARPERVVGLHFFNPAPVLPLVEVVRTELVSDEVVRRPARVRRADRQGRRSSAATRPGFVVNRIIVPVLNDAVRVLDEGTASAEDIDRAMWPARLADRPARAHRPDRRGRARPRVGSRSGRPTATHGSRRRPGCRARPRPGTSAARRAAASSPVRVGGLCAVRRCAVRSGPCRRARSAAELLDRGAVSPL